MKKKWVFFPALFLAIAGLVMIGCKSDVPPPTGGVKAVEVTFGEAWSGIDLLDSVFHFAASDKIEAKGKVIAVTAAGGDPAEFVFNDKPGDWGVPAFQKTGIEAGTALDVDITLTAAMITNIAAASGGAPKGIRIGGNKVAANTLKVSFQQIKITRGGTVLLDLAEHLATFTVGDDNFGLILPGTMGFQQAGTVTAKVIEE
jgi:hypothetical protein